MSEFLKTYGWVAVWVGLAAWALILAIVVRRNTFPPPMPPSGTASRSVPCDPAWGSWFRDNSDKFLLLFAIMIVMAVTVHVLHHAGDSSQLQFMNGITSTLVGGFMTLVTGAVLRKSATTATSTTTPDPIDPSKAPTVHTEAVKVEEK